MVLDLDLNQLLFLCLLNYISKYIPARVWQPRWRRIDYSHLLLHFDCCSSSPPAGIFLGGGLRLPRSGCHWSGSPWTRGHRSRTDHCRTPARTGRCCCPWEGRPPHTCYHSRWGRWRRRRSSAADCLRVLWGHRFLAGVSVWRARRPRRMNIRWHGRRRRLLRCRR